MKIKFRCKNGHEYWSKETVTTLMGQILSLGKYKRNDKCKICKSDIIAEEIYDSKGKIVAGALRI